eukprot:TRINITY_DN13841_c0_g1_i1.p1 TRINITY_DN13841_c0_g1~~TRINITY_DN13841_c0_g1_i1.p1  ORF type:complete len:123 (+),score=12.50 TRINITY_DN13841_c0_g1_i1:78-446(+)
MDTPVKKTTSTLTLNNSYALPRSNTTSTILPELTHRLPFSTHTSQNHTPIFSSLVTNPRLDMKFNEQVTMGNIAKNRNHFGGKGIQHHPSLTVPTNSSILPHGSSSIPAQYYRNNILEAQKV